LSKIQIFSNNVRPETKIIISISPCRSGSTAILRVFGAAGIKAHYQQIKTLMRWETVGTILNWEFPHTDDIVFLKETLGPYNTKDATLNPINVLIDSGIRLNQITILILGRKPVDTWRSWKRIWGNKTNKEIFNLAYETTELIRLQAIELKIETITVVYEAFKYDRDRVIMQIFDKLGILFCDKFIDDWIKLPPLGSHESNVIFPKQPIIYRVDDLHSALKQSRCFEYLASNCLTAESNHLEISNKTNDLYGRWKLACNKEFGINIGS